jgi:hypothetical protein
LKLRAKSLRLKNIVRLPGLLWRIARNYFSREIVSLFFGLGFFRSPFTFLTLLVSNSYTLGLQQIRCAVRLAVCHNPRGVWPYPFARNPSRSRAFSQRGAWSRYNLLPNNACRRTAGGPRQKSMIQASCFFSVSKADSPSRR